MVRLSGMNTYAISSLNLVLEFWYLVIWDIKNLKVVPCSVWKGDYFLIVSPKSAIWPTPLISIFHKCIAGVYQSWLCLSVLSSFKNSAYTVNSQLQSMVLSITTCSFFGKILFSTFFSKVRYNFWLKYNCISIHL